MPQKSLWFVLIISTLIVIVSVLAYQNRSNIWENQNSNSPEKPTIKIGAILPLTGNSAHIGQNPLKAARFAINKANESPNNFFHYEIIAEDSQLMPSKAVTALNKLISYDHINALISNGTGVGMAIQPIANTHKIIHIGAAYAHIADGKYNFQNYITSEDLVSVILDFTRKRGVKNIAILAQQPSGTEDLANKIEPILIKDGIRFSRYVYSSEERNFHLILGKIKNNEHDFILFGGYMPSVALIAKEIKIQHITIPTLGMDILGISNYDVDTFNGYYDIGVSYNKEWAEKLQLKSPYTADYIYDSINILIQAYETAGNQLGRTPSSDELRKALYEDRDHTGVIGEIHLEDDGLFHSEPVLKYVNNGKVETLKEVK